MKDLKNRVKELENSLSIALEINDKYQREKVAHILEIEKVKKECDRLMMEKIKKYETIIEELKAELARAKEDHQYDNLVHQKELERILKK